MSQSKVEQMGVSDARANLTEVIAKVRLLGQPVALTRREKPQAMLISMDRWQQACHDAEVRPLWEYFSERLNALYQDPEFRDLLERKDAELLGVISDGGH